MYKQIIIVGNINFDIKLLDGFDYLITNNIKLTSLYQCIIDDEIIDFDYLIITNKISKRIMSEDGYVITNNNFETSIENYFAIGECVKSTKTVDEQLQIIVEYIKGNY